MGHQPPVMAPVNRPLEVAAWLEDAQAVLDEDGRVREITPPLRAWLGTTTRDGAPEAFWPCLSARCPDSAGAIDKVRQSPEVFNRIELREPGTGNNTACWYVLETVRAGSSTVVRVNSALPSRSELEESGWGPQAADGALPREMFIRLLRAESRLNRLTAHWPGVIFIQRPDLSFEWVSPQIEGLTGVKPDQWQRQPQWFWQAVHEADAPEIQQQIKSAGRTGQPTATTFRLRHLQTGRISYVLEHRQPLLSQGGLVLGYEGLWLDVTRQTIAEKRLLSAAWKETLAVLTMGLAHDFGNVMAGIHSLSESFLEQLPPEHPFQEGLGLIKKNSLQASELVHRIIHLHVGKTGERNYHDLNAVVTELQDLVRKIIPRRVQLNVELAPGQLPIYVDAVEFRQTIVNLALNAADAMPEKGRLELRTARFVAWPEAGRLQGTQPRLPAVRLSVSDTGCGIKARHLEVIFDPFFTTKSANKGSGLGLYNARLFIEKHRGAISVESTEGHGATFHLWLPEADFSEAEQEPESGGPAPLRRLSLLLHGPAGRLLDETAELLRTHNYHVLTAHTPEAALAALRAGDCICSALVMLMEIDDASLGSLLTAVRHQYPMLKLVLKPVGRDRDDLRPDQVQLLDLVVSPTVPEHAFLDQLRTVLQAEADA